MPRPGNDRFAPAGDAAIGGTVPGLTGAAAVQAAGAAAGRFRAMAADRNRQLSDRIHTIAAHSAGPATAAPLTSLLDDDLHTAWGTAFYQSNGAGLQATHSLLSGAAAVTHGEDVVYAPTSLPSGGACMEMTTAYTSTGPVLWAWMWCGGNDTVGKLVNIDSNFRSTYTTQVNGQAAYNVQIRKTNAAKNTWTSYLYNYTTHTWNTFFTKSGTYDLGETNFGWDMFEIYATTNPATHTAWYCSSMAGKKIESSNIKISTDGSTFSTATSSNSYSYGDPPPAGSTFDCPTLSFTMVHANNNWTARM